MQPLPRLIISPNYGIDIDGRYQSKLTIVASRAHSASITILLDLIVSLRPLSIVQRSYLRGETTLPAVNKYTKSHRFLTHKSTEYTLARSGPVTDYIQRWGLTIESTSLTSVLDELIRGEEEEYERNV